MTQNKDFSYVGIGQIITPNISESKITNVEFLVPVKITVKHKNGVTQDIIGQVNWNERIAYFKDDKMDSILGEKMFSFLESKLFVEEDNYAASPDLIEKAETIHDDFEDLYLKNVGEA